MTDRLSIYNGALLLTGSRRLANLSENQESRRVLDDVWDGGGVKHCLEKGFWNHALRTMKLDYDPSITPSFGYQRAFEKPTDLVRIMSICTDEYYRWPQDYYQDDGSYWFADEDELYIRYVSDDDAYGMDFSLWPESFTRFVEGYFADRIIKRLTDAKSDAEDVKKEMRRLLSDALSKDAQKDPTGYIVPGNWQRSRWGNTRRRPPYR